MAFYVDISGVVRECPNPLFEQVPTNHYICISRFSRTVVFGLRHEWFFLHCGTGCKKKVRKCGRSTALVFSMQVSGVCLPEVVVIERDGTGLVGRAVVQQAAVHNELPVRAI